MIEINLLPEELKTKIKQSKNKIKIEVTYLLYLIPLLVAVLICVHMYLFVINIFKSYELNRLNKRWVSLDAQRKELDKFTKEDPALSEEGKYVRQLVDKRIGWAEKLNKLSLLLPPGIWFNEFSVSGQSFLLQGTAVSLQKTEMSLIKEMIDSLKQDQGFFTDFDSLELSSVQRRKIGGFDVDDFILTGKLKPK